MREVKQNQVLITIYHAGGTSIRLGLEAKQFCSTEKGVRSTRKEKEPLFQLFPSSAPRHGDDIEHVELFKD